MHARTALVAALLTLPLLAMVPAAVAQAPAGCSPAADPAALALDSPTAGNDVSAASPAASVATDDCYFRVSLPGGPEAYVGKELQISIAQAEDHNVFVARGANLPSAAPYVCSSSATTATSDACRVYWPLTQSQYTIRIARVAAGASDFTITASIVAAPASGCSNGYAITPVPLNVAQSVTVSGPAGSRCYFSFVAAASDDVGKAIATGLPASLGSYVIAKPGDVPTPTTVPGTANTGDYGCSPPLTGSTRTCAGVSSLGATWYAVLIRGTAITTTPTPFGITGSSAKSCSLGTGTIDVALDTPIVGSVDGSAAAMSCKFHLAVNQPQSLSKWSVTSNGANVDIYQRGGQQVASGVYDCGAAVSSTTGTDTCAIQAGGWSDIYGLVYRPAAGATLGTFSLVVSAVEGCPGQDGLNELATGVAISASLANVTNAACRFHYVPNPDDATVRITAAPSSGAQSLLVKRASAPTPTVYDCSASAAIGAAAVCDLENLGDEVYATLRRSSGIGQASVNAIGLSPCSLGGGDVALSAGVPVSGALTEDLNGACRFKIDVPALDGDAAAFELTPAADAGDFDLYVRKGARPTASQFDCKSSTLSNAVESCLSALDAGTYYAMVLRVSGSGAFSVKADRVSTCSLGVATSALETGVALSGSLLNVTGAKCFFAITPGSPLLDPAHPTDDVLKLALSGDGANNFDLYVRKGAVPSTASKDCQSIQAAGIVDACELVVGDGSTYYALVRRTAGGGSFSILGSSSSSCALGSGYHALPNGLDVKTTTRQLAGAKCFFSLSSGPKDDLLSIAQSVDPAAALTSFSVVVAKDHPASVAPSACPAATSYYYPISGLVLQAAAQCDQLLEDGLAHDWFVSVARTAGSAPDGAAFTIKGSAVTIPTLVPGVPRLGHVDTGTTQYYKVVLPENATFLDIQTAGDVSNLACSLGAQANSLVSTACLLLPFPKLVGCALAAGYGVNCATTQETLLQRCITQTGDAASCQQVEDARLAACDAINSAQNGTCDPSATSGTVNGACSIVNDQAGAGTCDPDNASVKTTELDLVVRHRAGLPSSTKYDCRSAQPGAAERCMFSDDVKEIHDNTTEPARAGLNEQLGNVTTSIGGNRTAVDQAIADLKAAIAENRTSVIEPLWATVRQAILDASGTDPGALPATPSAGVPATPNAVVGDQLDAKPLPGPGKYFIAVRGPLDLASSLYYKGGDYAIVALHDDLKAPSRDDLVAQGDGTLATIDRSLREQCAAQTHQDAVCANIDAVAAAICDAVIAAGLPCSPPSLGPSDTAQALCDIVAESGAPCDAPELSLSGLCEALSDVCVLIDGVLVALDEVLATVDGIVDGLPVPDGGEAPEEPELPRLPNLNSPPHSWPHQLGLW